MVKLRTLLQIWDKQLLRYFLLWKLGATLYPTQEYLWVWYKKAFEVRKDDNIKAAER
jgi:hypothetical protein